MKIDPEFGLFPFKYVHFEGKNAFDRSESNLTRRTISDRNESQLHRHALRIRS